MQHCTDKRAMKVGSFEMSISAGPKFQRVIQPLKLIVEKSLSLHNFQWINWVIKSFPLQPPLPQFWKSCHRIWIRNEQFSLLGKTLVMEISHKISCAQLGKESICAFSKKKKKYFTFLFQDYLTVLKSHILMCLCWKSLHSTGSIFHHLCL